MGKAGHLPADQKDLSCTNAHYGQLRSFMMFARLVLAIAVVFTTLAPMVAAAANQPIYAEGQIWAYHTRPEDPSSLIKINKIEVDPASAVTPIYHICVVMVHIGGSATPKSIAHLPVSRQTLDSSVIAPAMSSVAFPDSAVGIAQWRSAHGGVFTIPVAQIVEIVDQSARKPLVH